MNARENADGNAWSTPRVGLIHKGLPRNTGIGRYEYELESGLRDRGVDLCVAETRSPAPTPIARVIGRSGVDVNAFFRSYPIRADIPLGDLIHLTSQTLASLCMTQRRHQPVVVTVHDILPYLLRNDPELRFYRNRADAWMDWLSLRGLRRADRLIANSAYTKQTLVDVLGIDPGRIDVVYLGVDTVSFAPRPIPDEFRHRYDLPEDRPYLLYVGSDDPRKDLDLLLHAMCTVCRHVPDAMLLKVGSPGVAARRENYLSMTSELGLDRSVRWFDDVPEADLPSFYNVANVFAFPSRFEGFGFPVLEALACGTPVVARKVSSIPELTGDMAVLIDSPTPGHFGDELAECLISRTSTIEALRSRACAFEWSTTIAGTLAAYSRALGTQCGA